jgi:diguanylate cyclase (GGDEF)-like protein
MKSVPLRALMSTIALVVALTTTICVPAGYFALGYVNMARVLNFKAELSARNLARYIYTHDTLWQYERVRLAELLEEIDDSSDTTSRRIVDAAGRLVLEDGALLAGPQVSRSSPIVVAGQTVGSIAVAASLEELIRSTGFVALGSLLLGLAVYLAVRAFPLRVVDHMLGTLETTNRRFDEALSNMSQGLCMLDARLRVVVCNARFLAIFGLPAEAVVPGVPVRDVIALSVNGGLFRESAEEILAEKQRMMAEKTRSVMLRELTDGRVISIVHQPLAKGGWLVTFEDITERRRAEAKIAFMARHDTLTGLPNRVLFREQMEEALARRRGDGQVAVLCIDLDNFKAVNDTLGHPVGDDLLKIVARRLGECMRDTDMVARLGGDEFAIVQCDAAQPAAATTLASRIVDTLGSAYDLAGNQVVIGASVGIAIAPDDGDDPDQLLKNADMALYRAKADGRATYRFFEAEMDASAQARRRLELDLRAALANAELEVYYQPILALRTDEIVACEALVRWRHPRRGMVSPADFIPLAEETGLIVPLGEWVLRQACATAAGWPDHIRIAVNLSPVQFRSRNLVQTVIHAVAASGLAPCRLELEITEAVLLQDSDATLAILHALRDFGIRISMDDFGTGYSSLSYLRSFPFDKIKIDRSYIGELFTRADSMAIVRAVTGLGRTLGITTTAEGVETVEQLDLLRHEGCTEVQGYLFGKPSPAPEIARLLAPQPRRTVA